MQEEIEQNTIALAVKTGKLTGQVLQAAMKKFLAARQTAKIKPHQADRACGISKGRSALSNIEITDANIACFGPAPRNTALILPCGKTAPLIRPGIS